MTTRNLHLSAIEAQLYDGPPTDKFDAAARKSFLRAIEHFGGVLRPVNSRPINSCDLLKLHEGSQVSPDQRL